MHVKAIVSYQSVCAFVSSSAERFMMTVPISVFAELNIEFLFFTMISSERDEASLRETAHSNLKYKI